MAKETLGTVTRICCRLPVSTASYNRFSLFPTIIGALPSKIIPRGHLPRRVHKPVRHACASEPCHERVQPPRPTHVRRTTTLPVFFFTPHVLQPRQGPTVPIPSSLGRRDPVRQCHSDHLPTPNHVSYERRRGSDTNAKSSQPADPYKFFSCRRSLRTLLALHSSFRLVFLPLTAVRPLPRYQARRRLPADIAGSGPGLVPTAAAPALEIPTQPRQCPAPARSAGEGRAFTADAYEQLDVTCRSGPLRRLISVEVAHRSSRPADIGFGR